VPDQKQINRLKLMLDHAKRALEMADPDLKIVERLLSDAVSLAVEMNEPPNPYADKGLRPGLGRYDLNTDTVRDDGVALQSVSHPEQAAPGVGGSAASRNADGSLKPRAENSDV